jgi:hypothetical protein
MTRHKIEFSYTNRGRVVAFGDIVTFLYERGLYTLAQEFVERGNKAFEELDYERQRLDMFTTATTWNKECRVKEKKWWKL